jgi:hypothetical protein
MSEIPPTPKEIKKNEKKMEEKKLKISLSY